MCWPRYRPFTPATPEINPPTARPCPKIALNSLRGASAPAKETSPFRPSEAPGVECPFWLSGQPRPHAPSKGVTDPARGGSRLFPPPRCARQFAAEPNRWLLASFNFTGTPLRQGRSSRSENDHAGKGFFTLPLRVPLRDFTRGACPARRNSAHRQLSLPRNALLLCRGVCFAFRQNSLFCLATLGASLAKQVSPRVAFRPQKQSASRPKRSSEAFGMKKPFPRSLRSWSDDPTPLVPP